MDFVLFLYVSLLHGGSWLRTEVLNFILMYPHLITEWFGRDL